MEILLKFDEIGFESFSMFIKERWSIRNEKKSQETLHSNPNCGDSRFSFT